MLARFVPTVKLISGIRYLMNMFDLKKKNQIDFGLVSAEDDGDVEIVRLGRESRH